MKKSILFITEELSHYRIALFESLTEKISLTIGHFGEPSNKYSFKEINLRYISLINFKYIKLSSLHDYDIVIFPFNIRIVNIILFSINPLYRNKKPKFGLFGIGLKASYNNKYDSSFFDFFLRKIILRKFEFSIFYDNYPKIKFQAAGINPSKLSVAFNTVNNPYANFKTKSGGYFLFLGSLYKAKKINILIDAYVLLCKSQTNLPKLKIVGSGSEYLILKEKIKLLALEKKIILLGEIIDNKKISEIYSKSLVTISPNQAGLSVLNSFSNGCGFISSDSAITGGERFNIIDGVTGNFFDGSIEDLSKKMLLYTNLEYANKIGLNAFNFYNNFRNPSIWKEGFLKNIL